MNAFYRAFRNTLDESVMDTLRDTRILLTHDDDTDIRLFLQHPDDETRNSLMEFNPASQTMDMVANNWLPPWLVLELERDMTAAYRLAIETAADLNNARILTPTLGPASPPFGGHDSPRTIVGEGEGEDMLEFVLSECRGCRDHLANQQAHYGGCIQFDEDP